MESVDDKPDVASGVVVLLERELKAAQKRIMDSLEKEPRADVENRVAHPIEEASKQKIEALEQEVADLRQQCSAIEEGHKHDVKGAELSINALKSNVERLRYQNRWLHGELNAIHIKREEPQVKLEDIVKGEPKQKSESNAVDLQVQNVPELEKGLVEVKEKLKKQREAKRALRQTHDELQTTFEQVSAEKDALLLRLASQRTEMEARQKHLENENQVLVQSRTSYVETIQALEKDLDKLKEKYNRQREAKSSVRQTCEELEARLKGMNAEHLEKNLRQLTETNNTQCAMNADLRKKLAKKEKELEELCNENETVLQHLEYETRHKRARFREGILQASKIRHTFYNSGEFKTFLQSFPIPAIRPNSEFLVPVGQVELSLAAHLSTDPSLSLYSQSFIRLPSVIRWDHTMSPCHGLAFGPSLTHELNNFWEASSAFSMLHGQTKELFVERGKSLFYMGTYRCHPSRGWSEEGAVVPEDLSIQGVLDLASRDPGTNLQELKKKYRNGALRADCIILQCVDFNHAFYNRLVQLSVEYSSRKRKIAHTNTPSKKPKVA